MNIEDQCCSIGLAKKLKELGVKQKNLFCWYAFENPLNNVFKESDLDDDMWRIGNARDVSKGGADYTYSAFTVSELGEMLPFEINEKVAEIAFFKYENGYYVSYIQWAMAEMHDCLCETIDKNEANARAKMIIHLLENNLVTVDQINAKTE